jgi:hypothetical protein
MMKLLDYILLAISYIAIGVMLANCLTGVQ